MFIIAIIAPSRSGKDTLAKMLPCTNIKFSRPMKAALEKVGGLPEGALELDEYRSMQLPDMKGGIVTIAMESLEGFDALPRHSYNCSEEYRAIQEMELYGGTYLDALIATYHFFHKFAPMLPKRATVRQLNFLVQEKTPAVCTDIRMVEEAEIIIATGAPIVTVRLTRGDTVSLSTDAKSQELLALLKHNSAASADFDNSGSLEDLQRFADVLLATADTCADVMSKPIWVEGRDKVKIAPRG